MFPLVNSWPFGVRLRGLPGQVTTAFRAKSSERQGREFGTFTSDRAIGATGYSGRVGPALPRM
jgi:hypothetical protein